MSKLNGKCVMITRPLTQVRNRIWCVVCLIGLLGAAGCTNVPELDATIPDHLRHADYPRLVRLDDAFASGQNPQAQAEDIEKSLEARRRRLQLRAQWLQNLPD